MFYVPLRKEVRGEHTLLFPPPNFSILLLNRNQSVASGWPPLTVVLTVSAAELSLPDPYKRNCYAYSTVGIWKFVHVPCTLVTNRTTANTCNYERSRSYQPAGTVRHQTWA